MHWQLDEGKLSRSPDWSLGVYESSVVLRERNEVHNLSAPIVQVSIAEVKHVSAINDFIIVCLRI